MNNETLNSFTVTAQKTGAPIDLAMESLFVTGKIMPAGAKLIVEHKFVCGEQNPTEVVYSFGLPRNATLRRFKVKSKNLVVESKLKEREEAKKIYEKAIKKGNLAVQAQRYRDGIINLTVGNIYPKEEVGVYLEILCGVDIRDDGLRFRFPFTLAPCYHSLARVCEAQMGTGEIELPEEQFGDVFLPIYKKDSDSLHTIGFNIAVEMPDEIAEINSPSHPLKIRNVKPGIANIALSTEKDVPNRDLVLDIKTRKEITHAACEKSKEGTFHFYAIFPSNLFEEKSSKGPVNVVIVIDRSGSMGGVPIEQAKRAAKACLTALDNGDKFSVIAFDNSIEALGNSLINADKSNIETAFDFIDKIDARGGTELGPAIREAQSNLINSDFKCGDIFVITDGQVYATEDILKIAKEKNIRIHCLGIGSASQDRFINLIASETGGNGAFVTPRERIEEEALKLFNSIKTSAGIIKNYKFNGCKKVVVEPEFKTMIYQGKPLIVFGESPELPDGAIEFHISKNGESIIKTLPFKPELKNGDSFIKLLRGARIIDSIESQIGSFDNAAEDSPLLSKLTKQSKKYGLASGTMGLVAVIKRKEKKGNKLPITRVVPVGMPEDVQWGAYFDSNINQIKMRAPAISSRTFCSVNELYCLSIDVRPCKKELTSDDHIYDLVSQIEPDGGMPGKNEEERIENTILGLFKILDSGSYADFGVLRLHVRKMVRFLRQYEAKYPIISQIIQIAESNRSLPRGWKNIKKGKRLWEQLKLKQIIP
ncbi:MAG: VIT and vWA domain-containing protein [Verrucomicrobiia bacterium]